MHALDRLNQTLSLSLYRAICSSRPVRLSLCLTLWASNALAQGYDRGYEYAAEPHGPNMFARLMTSPGATLLMVLIGSAGVFNFFTGSSKKGAGADQKQLIGLGCILLVCLMVWYRFNVWNDTYRQR